MKRSRYDLEEWLSGVEWRWREEAGGGGERPLYTYCPAARDCVIRAQIRCACFQRRHAPRGAGRSLWVKQLPDRASYNLCEGGSGDGQPVRAEKTAAWC